MRKIKSDSFESHLVSDLVRGRYSYRAIWSFLRKMKSPCPKRPGSLRYHAERAGVSLTDSRNDLRDVKVPLRLKKKTG